MATVNAQAAISNVNNGRYMVRVQLLNLDGGVVADASSPLIEVTSNPAPVVGAPVVTVS